MFDSLARYSITIHFPESMPYWGVPGGAKVNGSMPHVFEKSVGGVRPNAAPLHVCAIRGCFEIRSGGRGEQLSSDGREAFVHKR